MEARLAGRLLFALSTAVYLYYTAWLLIVPFIDEDQPARRLFPPPYYAVAPPVAAGVLLFSVTLITLGVFLVSSELRKLRAKSKSA